MKKADLINHINKVTDDLQIKKYILEYISDLQDKYKNIRFKKKDFETLTFDGVKYEQDIVNSIFGDKKTVSATDIFYYNFTNFVESIDILDYTFKNSSGCYNLENKTILIKDYKNNEMVDSNMSTEEINQEIKYTLYHELSHIFEIKSFLNKKFCKIGFTNEIIYKENDKYFSFNKNNITTQEIYETVNKKLYYGQEIGKALFTQRTRDGVLMLSETLNEMFAKHLSNSFEIGTSVYKINQDSDLIIKRLMLGNCEYNLNYNLVEIMMTALDFDKELKMRTNSQILIDELNKLEISESKKAFVNKYVEVLLFYLCPDMKTKGMYRLYLNELKECDNYNLIANLMSFTMYNDQIITNSNVKNNIKVVIEDVLLDGLFNKIKHLQKYNSNNIYFYQAIDEILENISNLIYYPYGEVQYYKEVNSKYTLVKNYVHSLLPINRMFQSYDRLSHLRTFNNMIEFVKEKIKENNIEQKNLPWLSREIIKEKKFATILENSLKIEQILNNSTKENEK